MNELEKYFRANTGNLIHKWHHYFEIYDRHFARYRGTDVHIVEFGIYHGGSLQMWKSYFGPRAKIWGVDINPNCKLVEEEQIQVLVADQDDRESLRTALKDVPRIDILIDDGGHTMRQQINTFEELYARVAPDGIYLCEDLHTSYWKRWQGGYRKPSTFIEYSKDLIDKLHAWHSEDRRLAVDDFTRSTHSLHVYDSVLVIEKRPMQQPIDSKTGVERVPEYKPTKTLATRLKRALRRRS